MIFGANSPIGFEIAWEMVKNKALVIVVCRTMEKALEVRENIASHLASLNQNKNKSGNLEDKHDRALTALYHNKLVKSIKEQITADECDCSDLVKVKEFVKRYEEDRIEVYCLVYNASSFNEEYCTVSKDIDRFRMEMTVAVNIVAPHLIQTLVQRRVLKKQGRFILVTCSCAYNAELDWDLLKDMSGMQH